MLTKKWYSQRIFKTVTVHFSSEIGNRNILLLKRIHKNHKQSSLEFHTVLINKYRKKANENQDTIIFYVNISGILKCKEMNCTHFWCDSQSYKEKLTRIEIRSKDRIQAKTVHSMRHKHTHQSVPVNVLNMLPSEGRIVLHSEPDVLWDKMGTPVKRPGLELFNKASFKCQKCFFFFFLAAI